MTKTSQVDLLLDKYKKHLRTISKEQEKLALSYDEDDEDFEIRIPMTKKMVKRFIKYYNLSCLYEYLDDGVTFETDVRKHDEYYKELCKVYVAMQRLKDNFYKEMYRNFLNHNVALFDFEDEGIGESECDLMTSWADDIQTQVKNFIKYVKQENDDDKMDRQQTKETSH